MSLDSPKLLETSFSSIDELTKAARGYDLDFRQLDAGRLAGHVSQIYDGQSMIAHIRLNRRVHQLGQTPPGMLTFGLLAPNVSVRWHGRDVDGKTLLVFAGEIDAVSAPGFEGHTFSFSEQRLFDVSQLTGFTDGQNLFGAGVRAVRVHVGPLNVLRQCVALLDDHGHAEASTARHTFRRYALDFEIPAAVLRVLALPRGEVRRPPWRARDLARQRALAFIEANPDEPLTLRDLCRATRASARTLEYAFAEHFGVGPKVYLRAVRLNAVRRALHQADPAEKVADLANRSGFWHMGQFAADYRKYFGELPSETLVRVRRARSCKSPRL